MPFYEYQCRACGAHTEVLQKISDAPLRKCPECGKNQLQKLVSAPVFRLKGGGWYETDFKSDADRKRNLVGADKDDAPAEKPAAEGDKAKSDEGAKDAKPAASTEKPTDAKPRPAATKVKPKPGAARKPAKPAAKKRSTRR